MDILREGAKAEKAKDGKDELSHCVVFFCKDNNKTAIFAQNLTSLNLKI